MNLMFDQDKYLAGLFEFNNRNLSMKTIPRKKNLSAFLCYFFFYLSKNIMNTLYKMDVSYTYLR